MICVNLKLKTVNGLLVIALRMCVEVKHQNEFVPQNMFASFVESNLTQEPGWVDTLKFTIVSSKNSGLQVHASIS